MKRTLILAHPEARRRAHAAIDDAPDGYACTIGEPTRTLSENALLHSLIGEIAATHKWAGKARDVETWKRLLVAAWCRVRGDAVELLPALDGHGVDILPARTSKLSKAECAELIDFVQCWMAEHAEVPA